jgi:XTP/dITP diphosphohydrolase
MPKLLLATTNPAKLREYLLLLGDLPFQLATPGEEGLKIVVNEIGTTLEENAKLKASIYATQSQLLTLADDSGLEVDVLGGEPGFLSSRYAGESASDKEKVALLLSRLRGVPWERRSARFRCVAAIVPPGGVIKLCDGECQGIISIEPRGEQGFGYDPIFYLPQRGKTMAELPAEEKNQLSHRGKAAEKVRQLLRELYS